MSEAKARFYKYKNKGLIYIPKEIFEDQKFPLTSTMVNVAILDNQVVIQDV